MRRKQLRALRTYEQTMDAAAEAIVRSGYTRTTLAEVAARTGMTKGALYGHFASKEAVAAALVAHGTRACERAMADAAENARSPLGCLRLATLGLVWRITVDVRVHAGLRLAAESADEVPGSAELLDSVAEFLARNAVLAQEAGEIPPPHAPGALADLLMAVVLGYERLLSRPGATHAPADIDQLWHLLTHVPDDMAEKD